MIQTKHVHKHFGSLHVLNDISFDIAKGEIVAFLGQNGAGKTTLMRVLTGFLPAGSGDVIVADEDVAKNALKARQKIGYLPEVVPLYPSMSVNDYLKFAARLKDVPAKSLSVQVDRVCSQCQLKQVQTKTIGTLSKGFKQRVGIAQAIINEPEVLILDEPTSGLDPVQILHVRKLIKELESTRTVIVSTHILSEIEQLAKRVLIIKDGVIKADDSLKNLLNDRNQGGKLIVRLKGDLETIEQTIRQTDSLKLAIKEYDQNTHILTLEVTSQVDDYNPLIEKLLSAKTKILEISPVPRTLEDVFFDFVSKEETA